MFCSRRLFLSSLPTGNVLFKKGFSLGFEKSKINNLVKYFRQAEQISSSSEMLRDQKWLESWEQTTLTNIKYHGTMKQKITMNLPPFAVVKNLINNLFTPKRSPSCALIWNQHTVVRITLYRCFLTRRATLRYFHLVVNYSRELMILF